MWLWRDRPEGFAHAALTIARTVCFDSQMTEVIAYDVDGLLKQGRDSGDANIPTAGAHAAAGSAGTRTSASRGKGDAVPDEHGHGSGTEEEEESHDGLWTNNHVQEMHADSLQSSPATQPQRIGGTDGVASSAMTPTARAVVSRSTTEASGTDGQG